ncbi:biosynthetic-type acetolactate synthase large subunit [Kallotenue papyrolyticum]|uniref:biosynthetic-type acetolactate synthase large subunit n=1 Tax=Kallotenue papyrolyticum TaxID=1325125 RepID=UPI0004785699|nr:biosynthetic-type acetolactate synthase large subunit [Kallotenue papyrolyticum]
MSDTRTGAQIMCEALIREGVEVLFGYPGGAIMPFYHALPEYPQLRHVLVRHEQAAGHMAEGYARASGKVGVCVATSGPGATNLVTAIADAMMDSVPIVAITGQVAAQFIGKDAFQETDVTGITQPITKHNYLVTDVADLAYVFKEAFHIARTGRPGPVLIDVAKNAQQARTVPQWPDRVNLPGYKPTYEGNRRQIREAIRLIGAAQKPLILAGRGVLEAGAMAELRELAERTGIPVITTLHGIGCFPENHPLALGMPGMHGWVHNNRAIQECDLLINIGSRFDDRVTGKTSTFAPHAKIIHIDIDPSEIGKNIRVDVPIVGDAQNVLRAMLEELPPRECRAWVEHIYRIREQHMPRQQYTRPDTDMFMPHDFFTVFSRIINERGPYRVCTDVGQHQMWAAQLIEWRHPYTHITSGGLGTMGFALPAAIGVQIACPDETVWAVAGDGGFQMNIQELATIRQERLPVKIAIINNGYLGMVRQWQELFHERRYSATPLWNPDFVKVAEAYGIPGICVTHQSQVEDAINAAYATDGPILLEFQVEREVNVYPMVAPGASIHEMITESPMEVV